MHHAFVWTPEDAAGLAVLGLAAMACLALYAEAATRRLIGRIRKLIGRIRKPARRP